MELRKCKRCGKMFLPKSSPQLYCNTPITTTCSVCGKQIDTICNPNKIPNTCSRSCSSKASIEKEHRCASCSEIFVPKTHRQIYCKKPIERTCEVCGNTYIAYCGDSERKTCNSKTCRSALNKQLLESYYSKTERICVLCGKTYNPTNNSQKYCKKLHPIKCKVCGKIFITDTSKQDFATTCSKECRYKAMIDTRTPEEVAMAVEKAKKTNLERYGVEHPAQNPEVLKKMQQTSFERFGDTSFVRTEAYIEKSIQTNREKYGADWASKTKENKEKRKATNLEKYGVENVASLEIYIQKAKETYFKKTGYHHPSENPEVIHKRELTNIERFGSIGVLANPEIRNKAKQTMLENHGVDSPMKSEEIRNKAYNTNLEKYGNISYLGSEQNRQDMKQKMIEMYGVTHYSKSKEWKIDRMKNPEKIDNWIKFLEDPRAWLESYKDKPNLHMLEQDLGVNDGTIMHWISYYKLNNLVKYTLSSVEDDIVALILNIDKSIKIDRHNRRLIPGNEIDIVLPEYHVAIEVDPTVTHNSSICNPWGDKPKSKDYHKMKTDRCEGLGYTLYHIFGYELTNQMDFVESNIRNLLDKPKYSVDISKCNIVKMNKETSDDFIHKNSIEPAVKASVRYGVIFDGNLLAVMTFGKLHKSKYIKDTKDSWEILNMCTKINTKVIDWYSSVLNKFIDEYNPMYILASSDRSYSSGKEYKSIGFSCIDITAPRCIWVDINTDIQYYDYETRKCNLHKLLDGIDIDETKTERELLEENGFVMVFDSGKDIWML